MQRHRLPSRPCISSAGVGATPRALQRSSVACVATTKPGVQKPHCDAWWLAYASAQRHIRLTATDICRQGEASIEVGSEINFSEKHYLQQTQIFSCHDVPNSEFPTIHQSPSLPAQAIPWPWFSGLLTLNPVEAGLGVAQALHGGDAVAVQAPQRAQAGVDAGVARAPCIHAPPIRWETCPPCEQAHVSYSGHKKIRMASACHAEQCFVQAAKRCRGIAAGSIKHEPGGTCAGVIQGNLDRARATASLPAGYLGPLRQQRTPNLLMRPHSLSWHAGACLHPFSQAAHCQLALDNLLALQSGLLLFQDS